MPIADSVVFAAPCLFPASTTAQNHQITSSAGIDEGALREGGAVCDWYSSPAAADVTRVAVKMKKLADHHDHQQTNAAAAPLRRCINDPSTAQSEKNQGIIR